MTFQELATYFHTLESTASRLTMTETLASLFAKVTPVEIEQIAYLLQGRVGPLYDAVEFGVADKFMIRAISLAYGVSEEAVLRAFRKFGDLGAAAEANYQGKPKSKLSVSDVYDQLAALAHLSGLGSQEKKIQALANILSSVDALSARYICRIPLDKLRLGFSEMTILDALSWMIGADKTLRAKMEAAYNLRPDIGFIARKVKEDGVKGLSHVRARVGAPILAALCQRLSGATEMIAKMGTVAVEPKYDGVRVQIHFQKSKEQVLTYSRDLKNTSGMFMEVDEVGKFVRANEVILDAEAVGIDPKTQKIISFQETVSRKRKHDIEEAMKSIPLRFYVFDILYKDGVDLLSVPLSKRREILVKTMKDSAMFQVSPQIVTSDADELRKYHEQQRRLGLEGVVVKKWESQYEPGRRGYNWVKFKEEDGKRGKLADTVDGIVMGYYRGEGKRSDFGIGAFLVGVRKGDSFVTVTKVGTGVSDELWRELKAKLHAIASKIQPKEYEAVSKNLVPDEWVTPRIVVEIAADDITKSPNHGAGYALRFPRLIKIRTDKSVQEATSQDEIVTMFNNQNGGVE